jgi:hypothetical protein
MGLETHPNKHSHLAAKNAARRPYVYTRGPQSRTLIREMRQQEQPETGSSNEYAKILEGLWLGITQENPLFDNQYHESGSCSCKCTPIPNEIRSRHSESKPAPEKEAV